MREAGRSAGPSPGKKDRIPFRRRLTLRAGVSIGSLRRVAVLSPYRSASGGRVGQRPDPRTGRVSPSPLSPAASSTVACFTRRSFPLPRPRRHIGSPAERASLATGRAQYRPCRNPGAQIDPSLRQKRSHRLMALGIGVLKVCALRRSSALGINRIEPADGTIDSPGLTAGVWISFSPCGRRWPSEARSDEGSHGPEGERR